jgi:inosine-uridine nucleoside N-ribohydrolase
MICHSAGQFLPGNRLVFSAPSLGVSMTKLQKAVLAALVSLHLSVCSIAQAAPEREMVLLDSDMVEAFDDGVAMLMLAKADNVKLVGITTVSGNTWQELGTAYALRQLQDAKVTGVPVAAGTQFPLHPHRWEYIDREIRLIGRGHDEYFGAFQTPKPLSWQAAYREAYGEDSPVKPVDKHAVNFIIDTIRANPGKITIAAIGPCTNLALAVRMAPDIVPLIKRVIYMGGAFYQQGNITPAAEFNWWFDPMAARIAVRSPFKEQIVVSLDVCEKVVFRREHYVRILETMKKAGHPMASMFKKTFVGQNFQKNPNFQHFVWDAIVSAIIIDPTIVTEEVTRYIDVNDQYGLSYGQSLAYPRVPPGGARKARIILSIDIDRFWNMVNDPKFWKR